MKDIERILFPVDLSEVSPIIAPAVLMVSRRFEAEVHLLFVARSLDHLTSVYVSDRVIEHIQAELIRGAEIKMEEFRQGFFASYPRCLTRVVAGDPAEEILSYAQKEAVDLIIMGTHGRKGLERLFFGSVADKVIKTSPVPVMSVNPYRMRAH